MRRGMVALRLSYRDLILKQPKGKPLPILEILLNGLVNCRMQHHAQTGLCLGLQDKVEFRLKLNGKQYRVELKESSIPVQGNRDNLEWMEMEEVLARGQLFRNKQTGYPKLLIHLTRLGKDAVSNPSCDTIDSVRLDIDESSFIDKLNIMERKAQHNRTTDRDTVYERISPLYNNIRQNPFEQTHRLASKLVQQTRLPANHIYSPLMTDELANHRQLKNNALHRIFETFDDPELFQQEEEQQNSSTFTLY